MTATLLDRLGAGVGMAAEAFTRAWHVHRMRRSGHLAAHAPITALHDHAFPVRDGNRVELLVDGDAAFARMADAIRGATRTVHITNWTGTADFALERGEHGDVTLGQLLRDASARGVRSRVLLWRGAPAPFLHPNRADGSDSARGFNAIPGVRCALDAHEYLLNCHHEKLLIVDDEIAFVGGLDFSTLGTDRWDSQRHPPRTEDGWHDVAVGVHGPVVADVARHFAQRWHEVAGERLEPEAAVDAAPAFGGEAEATFAARMVRTIPEGIYRFAPRGDFGIVTAYLDALRGAERLIWLENQFLWAVEVVDVLVEKLRNAPRDDFRLVVLLPDRAHTGQDASLGQLSRLVEADGGRGRLLTLTAQSLDAQHHVYVHAKVGIVDDRWLTIGSANLNSHSMFNDTEVNLVFESPELAIEMRRRLWREHAGDEAADGDDPIAVIDTVIAPMAREQSRRRAAGLEPTARIRLLDHVSNRTGILLGPVSSLVLDG